MKLAHLEREPLAYQVRLFAHECFDSWLDRIVRLHATTRSLLFGHLDIDSSLATRDLGISGYGRFGGMDQMAATLAWATGNDAKLVVRSLMAIAPTYALPRGMRVFGCARCAQNWILAGEQCRVLRSWIYRTSWRCERHALIFSDLRRFLDPSRKDRDLMLTQLRREIRRMRDLEQATSFDELRLAATRYNELDDRYDQSIVRRLEHPWIIDEFRRNCFHYSTNRSSLMASWHSVDSTLVDTFAANLNHGSFKPALHVAMPGDIPATGYNLKLAIASVYLRQVRQHAGRLSHLSGRLDLVFKILVQKQQLLSALGRRLDWLYDNYEIIHSRANSRKIMRARSADFSRRLAHDIKLRALTQSAALSGLLVAHSLLEDSGWASDSDVYGENADEIRNLVRWEDIKGDAAKLACKLDSRFSHPSVNRMLCRLHVPFQIRWRPTDRSDQNAAT